jgi:hypothetical protein
MDTSYRSSVEPHCFGSSKAYTVGVEEEYMLLDAVSLGLVQRADTILDVDRDGDGDGDGEFAGAGQAGRRGARGAAATGSTPP